MKTNDYPLFVPNQILTSTHLNQLQIYLDEQNRLTRTHLTGSGIVCGLEVKYGTPDTPANTITVTKGYGISSGGYLFGLDETLDYTQYKDYTDPTEPAYERWIDANQQIDLKELLPAGATGPGVKSVADLSNTELNKKVVVLYLERKDEELQTCTGSDCDHKGKERILTPRVLLVDKQHLAKFFLRDLVVRTEDFPEIVLQRLPAALQELSVAVELKTVSNYDQIAGGYMNIVDDFKATLANAILDAHEAYRELLGLKDFDTQAVTALSAKVFPLDAVQYAYDFLKDLALAYNEFKNLAYALGQECCPALPEFPRHLMLGKLKKDTAQPPEAYRHYFVDAPPVDGQDDKILKAQWLFERILLLIDGFEVLSDAGSEIKITPSETVYSPLSRRAIPYYYNNAQLLSDVWNPGFGLKDKPTHVLSYNQAQYNNSPQIPQIDEPLKYAYDEYPFLRIEGHLGHGYQDVINDLEQKKEAYNLPFEIVPLKLSQDTSKVQLTGNCPWQDLQTAYLEYRGQIICMLSNLITGISKAAGNGTSFHWVKLIDEEFLKMIKELKARLPECLDSFVFNEFADHYYILVQKLIQYKLSLNYLLGRLIHGELQNLTAVDAQILEDAFKSWLRSTVEFIDSCVLGKLTTVYLTYQWRLEHIRANHLSIFSNFVRQHPGVEHLAGVPKGGSFILVYQENDTDDTSSDARVVADFALPYPVGCECCQVPVCDGENGAAGLKLPPIARDDDAETVFGQDVTIHFMRNDYALDGSRIGYVTHDEESKMKGKVGLEKDENGEPAFIYSPPAEVHDKNGFFDQFAYTIRSDATEIEAKALVTVLVHPPYTHHSFKDCFEVVFKDKASEFFVLTESEVNDKAELRVFIEPGNYSGGVATEFGEAKVVDVNGKTYIHYQPHKDFIGRDWFGYAVVGPGYIRGCYLNVIVICECGQGALKCIPDDLTYTAFPGKEITVDFNIYSKLKVTNVVKPDPKIVDIIFKAESNILQLLPGEGLWEYPQFTIDYSGTLNDMPCQGAIKLNPSTAVDRGIIGRNRKVVEDLKASPYTVEMISADAKLSANVERSAGFIELVDRDFKENPEALRAGQRNNAILEAFKASTDPLILEVRNINAAIKESGSTPKLEKQKEINTRLLSANLDTFLATLGTTDKDLSKNSNVYKYIDTELKSQLKSIGDTGSVDLRGNVTKLAGENATKNNYNLVLNNLYGT